MKLKDVLLKSALVVGTLTSIILFQNCAPSSMAVPNEALSTKAEIEQLSKVLSTDSPELEQNIEKRRQLMLELAKNSPAEVFSVALSESEQVKLPREIVDQIEKVFKGEGKIEKYYEDYPDGRHVVRHILRSKDERLYELRMSKDLSEKFLNRRVVIKGLKIPHKSKSVEADLVIEDISKDIYLLDGGNSSNLAYDIDVVNSSISKGEQKTLAILVNFDDAPTLKPWTVSEIQTLLFGSVNDFMVENSTQQTWLTGHVAGWYTIPVSSSVCDGFDIERNAKLAAQNSGYNLSNYSRFIYIFPKNAACGYSGMGQVGSVPSSSWIHNSANLRTIGHELIHNFGAYHSRAKDCGDIVLASSCSIQEYGDTVDIMGYTGTVGHLNSVSKERLGWIPPSQIMNVTADGDYFIAPSSASTGNVKTLKIYAGLDAATSSAYYYHVEFRQPIGFDTMIEERGIIIAANIFNGVTVRESRKSSSGSPYSSYLLDMTPGSSFVDMKDAALTPGNSFSDPVSGITITTLSVSSAGASIRIKVGAGSPPPPSDTTPPTVSITSPSNGAVISGIVSLAASASDNVSVVKVEFYVDGVLKGTDNSSPYSVSIDTKTLNNGSHILMAKAYDGANNIGSTQISVSVSNITADTMPPAVSIASPVNGAIFDPRTSVSIQANATDNVKIDRVEFYINGILACSDTAASYSCSYKLSGSKGEVYTIQAIAFDSSGNSSSHQISISSSSAGGGGGPKGGGRK